ncbi:MAG: nitrite reductase large subunit NirB [Sneathiella sp.]
MTPIQRKSKLVLIGNGMAGVRTIEEVLKVDPDHFDITIFGSEPHGNYNRIMLSPVLAGDKTIDEILLNDDAWYADNNITLHKGKTVSKIDRVKSQVIADDGTVADYDRLLIATGSDPFILPVPGVELPGVITFRDIADVDEMLDASKKHKNAVVIGGGLLGLEAAKGLSIQGMNVTVVHLMDSLMERQLDDTAARLLQQSLEDQGLTFLMGAQTETILGADHVTGVRFKDGTEVAADIVVMAVGIKPNKALAEKAGIYCERGVVVSDTMQTFDPKIYAVGECVQHRKATYGLVAPLYEQGKICANHLVDKGVLRYLGSLTSTKLKVTGVDLFSAGDFTGDDSTEEIIFRDPGRNVYKKLVLKDNRIQGSVMYGDTADGVWYFQLMREATDVSEFRDTLLFGQNHLGDSGHGAGSQTASMSLDTEICGCNGVCKGDIVQAITAGKLLTLDEVRTHTKASASCGSCTGLVEQILVDTAGGDFSKAPSEKPLCPCTDHPHGDVRRVIVENELMTIPAVINFMEWRTPDGCAKCRPALNYYLLCAWPADYQDDDQSRFINERAHANIQKDGTYSVVPRMWGGTTTSDELRAIADVADKFKIPTVKVTGGQRIDLLGVKKEDLPAVWTDLNDAGMVSGHAYGKSLRTVKTCVGSDWCRFGVQDSTGLGIDLEKALWGSWTPHKFKVAVSGCPRNCAESTIKDLGIVAVESGWELHVGGNGGIKVRVTDLLCKVKTAEEVMEYARAFMQFYREDAYYLERTAHWIDRVGIALIKEQIVEKDDARRAYADRLVYSQKFYQFDPWKAHATDQTIRREYELLKPEFELVS